MLNIAYSKEAMKSLKGMATDRSKLIRSKIAEYAAAPDATWNNIRRLKGSADYRMRVGDYRVIFGRDTKAMFVKLVRPRSSAYD
jgi:mRNA interferase RelE/StbE